MDVGELNNLIDMEYNKYRNKALSYFYMNKITKDEVIYIQKRLLHQKTQLHIKAIMVYLNKSEISMGFQKLLK